MKTIIKITKQTLLLFSILNCMQVFAQSNKKADRKADKETAQWRYQVECAGIGKEGTSMIKVWSYSTKADVAMEQAMKNAVHAIIFQGYAGGPQGCTPQKALTSNPSLEQQKEDFFKDFFADGGKFQKYVSSANDGAIGGGDRVKIGKEYKIGVIVIVMKENLRKDLVAAGVIGDLNSGF